MSSGDSSYEEESESDSSTEDDIPIAQRMRQTSLNAKREDESSSSSESDEPLLARHRKSVNNNNSHANASANNNHNHNNNRMLGNKRKVKKGAKKSKSKRSKKFNDSEEDDSSSSASASASANESESGSPKNNQTRPAFEASILDRQRKRRRIANNNNGYQASSSSSSSSSSSLRAQQQQQQNNSNRNNNSSGGGGSSSRSPPRRRRRTTTTAKTKTKTKGRRRSSTTSTTTTRKKATSKGGNAGYATRDVLNARDFPKKECIRKLEAIKGAQRWWEKSEHELKKNRNKWTTLDHNGVVFAPAYEAHGVQMKYNGKAVRLSPDQEEIATMFAVLIESDWAKKEQFRKNFMNEWKRVLRDPRQPIQHPEIKDLKKCDFMAIHAWYQTKKEAEKARRKETEYKALLKREKAEYDDKYGWALVDGMVEKLGNYKVEPPGLFRGRGQHPKMGMLKKRIMPEDIVLNVGPNTAIPRCPIAGHEWGGVIHDPTVTYIAKWIENINGQHKFVYLHSSSRFKGEADRRKYNKARKLKLKIDAIRADYEHKLVSQHIWQRQLATAVWMIDRLSIRVGNEKDTDEEADTVGVCSLRKEHMTLNAPTSVAAHEQQQTNHNNNNVNKKKKKKKARKKTKKKKKRSGDDSMSDGDSSAGGALSSGADDDDDEKTAGDIGSLANVDGGLGNRYSNITGMKFTITLDFLGKDSMRYHQTNEVSEQVYRNLKAFLAGKQDDMDIFEKIDPNKLNVYLKSHMEGLTAKVFRTHNASVCLQSELRRLFHKTVGQISAASPEADKKYFYDQCNRRVAILCNHQRTVSKSHVGQLEKINEQLQSMRAKMAELKEELLIAQGKKKLSKSKLFNYGHESKGTKGTKGKGGGGGSSSPPKKKRIRSAEQVERLLKNKELSYRKKKLQRQQKQENKEVALGTSKINYMDPRITVQFCKSMELPIEKVFNKSLLDKFPWAMNASTEYFF